MARFEFVEYTGPGDSGAAGQPRRRAVRSHAARNWIARRKRVAQYQEEKKREEEEQRQRQLEEDELAGVIAVDRGDWPPAAVDKLRSAAGFLDLRIAPMDMLSASREDPYRSFSRRMNPLDCYLLDHFANCMVWCAIDHYVICSLEQRVLWATRIANHWVQMAAQDPGIMAAILCAACRHVDMKGGTNRYHELALRYQVETVTSLRESLQLETDVPSDATIVKTMCLATEAATLSNTSVALKHADAAYHMYQLQESRISSPLNSSKDDKESSTRVAVLGTAPPRRQVEPSYNEQFSRADEFRDRKALLLLYDLKSPPLRQRAVQWKNATLDEGCFVYTQFMLSRISLAPE